MEPSTNQEACTAGSGLRRLSDADDHRSFGHACGGDLQGTQIGGASVTGESTGGQQPPHDKPSLQVQDSVGAQMSDSSAAARTEPGECLASPCRPMQEARPPPLPPHSQRARISGDHKSGCVGASNRICSASSITSSCGSSSSSSMEDASEVVGPQRQKHELAARSVDTGAVTGAVACLGAGGAGSPDDMREDEATARSEEEGEEEEEEELLSVSFNQDNSCFACGTTRGFRVFSCQHPPLRESLTRVHTQAEQDHFQYHQHHQHNQQHQQHHHRSPLQQHHQQQMQQLHLAAHVPHHVPQHGPHLLHHHHHHQHHHSHFALHHLLHPHHYHQPHQLVHEHGVLGAVTPAHQLHAPHLHHPHPLSFPGGIRIVEMLYRSNFMVLVGGGKRPRFPPNKVIIWDDNAGRCVGELLFRTEVRGVRVRRDRIVVLLEQGLHVYGLADLRPLAHFDTARNPRGLCAISQAPHPFVLACPGLSRGQVRVELVALHRSMLITAHEAAVAALAMTPDGTRVASASERGTLVRVFRTCDGTMLQELRRGADRAEIYSLAFSPMGTYLGLSSDKGTAHVFALQHATSPSSTSASNTNPQPPMGSGAGTGAGVGDAAASRGFAFTSSWQQPQLQSREQQNQEQQQQQPWQQLGWSLRSLSSSHTRSPSSPPTASLSLGWEVSRQQASSASTSPQSSMTLQSEALALTSPGAPHPSDGNSSSSTGTTAHAQSDPAPAPGCPALTVSSPEVFLAASGTPARQAEQAERGAAAGPHSTKDAAAIACPGTAIAAAAPFPSPGSQCPGSRLEGRVDGSTAGEEKLFTKSMSLPLSSMLSSPPSLRVVRDSTAAHPETSGGSGGIGGGNAEEQQLTPCNPGSSLAFMRRVLPRYFSSEWSLAQYRHLPDASRSLVAFGCQKNTLLVATQSGSFFRLVFDPAQGGEMRVEEHIDFRPPASSAAGDSSASPVLRAQQQQQQHPQHLPLQQQQHLPHQQQQPPSCPESGDDAVHDLHVHSAEDVRQGKRRQQHPQPRQLRLSQQHSLPRGGDGRAGGGAAATRQSAAVW